MNDARIMIATLFFVLGKTEAIKTVGRAEFLLFARYHSPRTARTEIWYGDAVLGR